MFFTRYIGYVRSRIKSVGVRDGVRGLYFRFCIYWALRSTCCLKTMLEVGGAFHDTIFAVDILIRTYVSLRQGNGSLLCNACFLC